MSNTTKERLILLLLNNGSKVEGVLIKIDKENLKMILEKAKLIKEGAQDELFDRIEVSKKDIKEIRVLEEKEVKKPEPKIEQETKETGPTQSNEVKTDSTFGSIPLNIQQQYQKDSYKYEKGGFFDELTISNNKDNYKEARTYNEKNKETFGIDDSYRGGHHKKRGGYRGRGGYHNKNYNNSYSTGGYNGYNNRGKYASAYSNDAYGNIN